jgi:hypothetical protein
MYLTSPITFPNLGITVDPNPVAFTIGKAHLLVRHHHRCRLPLRRPLYDEPRAEVRPELG